MQTQYQKVREFMQAFGQECPERPGIPSDEIRKLRWKLIAEEADELLVARDATEAFDAILDLLYVVLGAGIAYGISEEQIAKGLAEVHRSNLSKFWTNEEAAHVQSAILARGVYSDRPYIVRNMDGKIIKSPSYSPANLGPILEGSNA